MSVGPAQATETIRAGLAMGADRGILVEDRQDGRAAGGGQDLKAIVGEEKPGLVILGKQAIDDDCNQTGQMLAALTGWPQGTFASKLVHRGRQRAGDARGRRRLQTVKLKAPAIVTTDPAISTSRATPSLPNIMKAKKKPIEEKTPESYGVDVSPRIEVLKTTEPPGRKAGVKVKTGGRARRQA